MTVTAAGGSRLAGWTVRAAAIGLWVLALLQAGVGLKRGSIFAWVGCIVFAVWGFAVWRRQAINVLVAALVIAGLFIPGAVINPFLALDAPAAMVTRPGFAARVIGGALGVSLMALAGAMLLQRAHRKLRAQTAGFVPDARQVRARRSLAVLVVVLWALLVAGSTSAFLSAVRAVSAVQAHGPARRGAQSPLPPVRCPKTKVP